MSNRWYAYQMQPGREEDAAAQVSNLGFEVANIRELQRREKKHRIIFVSRPLFPGYGLVKFDVHEDQWRRVNSARNCIRLVVSSALSPIPAKEGSIESLMEKIRDDGYFHDDDQALYAPWLKLKDKMVRVEDGPFTSFNGICKMSENGRIKVLLSVFGRDTPVDLDWKQVTAL